MVHFRHVNRAPPTVTEALLSGLLPYLDLFYGQDHVGHHDEQQQQPDDQRQQPGEADLLQLQRAHSVAFLQEDTHIFVSDV